MGIEFRKVSHVKDHIEINDLLMAENKALKEELNEVRGAGIDLLFELRKVQASRDELLEAVSQSEIVLRNSGHKDMAKRLIPIIQRAALKEKANEQTI